MADWIFLDHHTKSKPKEFLIKQFAEEVQKYWFRDSTEKVEKEVREQLGLLEMQMLFTTNLAESHKELFFSHYMTSIRQTGRTHILTLENEQTSILKGIKLLEQFDVEERQIPLNENGVLTKTILKEFAGARSSLLSLSLAHAKTGILQPIHEIISMCKEKNIQIHLDVSVAIGKLFLELTDLDIDYLTLDAGLLGMPIPFGVIFSKKPLLQSLKSPYAHYSNLVIALKDQCDKVETYAMEVAPLRDQLETSLEKLGAHLPFRQAERLPNMAICQFEDIHSAQILDELKKERVFATHFPPFFVCFCLSDETKKEEVDRCVQLLPQILEKLRRKPRVFSKEDAKAKNMRVCTATLGQKAEGKECTLTLLVDEEDGVIADAEFVAFGPPALQEACAVACNELLRKNTMQARRMTANLIEKKLSCIPESSDLNLLIDTIDAATEHCMDIPIEDIYIAPPNMEGGERSVYPHWETLSNVQKKIIIAEVIEKEIQPYVELDAGGVEVLKVEDNRITIAYSGNCTNCFSATGATLDAIGGILRHKIYPDLMVIPDKSLLQFS